MAKNCGKWLKYLTNCLINWEMAQTQGARFKYFRDGIGMLQMT